MRTWILLATLILIAPTHAIAQDDPGPMGGDWALQFQITEDFTLSDFQGAIVSAKYNSSEQNAWRVGLGFNFRSSTENRDRTVGGVPDPGTSSENSQQAVRLDLQYLRYANPDARVQFLFGGGLFGGFDNRSSETFLDGVSRGRQEFDRLEVGVSGLVGVEWFVASRVSLHAEYGLEYLYAKNEGTAENPAQDSTASQDGDSWSFGPRGVLLGVSAYF